jgi:hypothetical protein
MEVVVFFLASVPEIDLKNSYLGFGTLCGFLGAHCFIFCALVPV